MASAMNIAINIVASAAGLEKAVSESSKGVGDLADTVEASSKKMQVAFAALSAAAVAELAAALSTTRSLAAEVGSLQRATGLMAEEASGLRFAGQQLGLTTDQMNTSFAVFGRNLVNGSTKLDAYGISLTNADGTQKGFLQILGEASDKFRTLPKGVSQSTFAMDVFGKSGRDLIPILNLGSQGIADLSSEAADFGLVIPQDTLDSAKGLTAATRDLSAAWQGFQLSIGATEVGPVTLATQALTEVVKAATALPGPLKAAALGIVAIGGAAVAVVPEIVGFVANAATAGPAMLKLGQMTAAGIKTATAAIMTGPWGIIIIAIAAVAAAIVVMVKLVQAGLSALSGGWSKMGGIMKAVLIVTAPLWLPIVAVIKVVQAIISALGAVVSFVFANWQSILKVLAVAFLPITIAIGLVMVAWNLLSGVVSAVASAIGSAIGAVVSWIADQWNQSKALFIAVWQGIQAAFEGVVNFFISGINMVIGAINFLIEGYNKIPFHEDIGTIEPLQKLGEAAQTTAPKIAAVGTAAVGAGQKVKQFEQISFQTATVMSNAWGNVGPKVAGSLSQITKAITQSLQAELKLQKNTSKVTNRLINDYGLTAEQAERTLADASPQAMATMAKASDKEFGKTGKAIQKVNHIIPSTIKGFQGAGKAVDGTSKAAAGAAKAAGTLSKGTEGVGKSATSATKGTTGLGKATSTLAKDEAAAGKAGSSAAAGIGKVGSSAQSGQSKVSGMVTQVSRLKSELNGLPNSITIQVTVNVNKTGASTGGLVPGLARGGVTTMSNLPLTTVGEHGEELVALPAGSRVFSHNDTSGMLADAMANAGSGGGGPMTISGKLSLVNGEAYIEGVVLDTLEDGRVVDAALTNRMRRP